MHSGKELKASKQGAQEAMCRSGCDCVCSARNKPVPAKKEAQSRVNRFCHMLPYQTQQTHAHTNELGLSISSLPKADLKQKRP